MSDVLLEIGMEELPARFIDDAQKQLKINTQNWLEQTNITFGVVKTFATPRRLAVIVEGIAEEQKTTNEELKGPQMKIAKDSNGEWTKAAIGFTKGQGKTVDDIYTKTVKGNEYIYVNKTTEGQKTLQLLPNLKSVINSLIFPQTMRWGNKEYRFPRPIRWITALYDDTVIPLEIAGVVSGNVSRGHRFLGQNTTITAPSRYEELLEKEYVIVDPLKREALILEGIRNIESTTSFHIEVEEALLEEVRNLVEYPTVFYGEFDPEYLTLPKEVLITSMKEHQRYFPVFDKEKATLFSYFVSVRNGDSTKIENVIRGNEKVLRARLQDADFFYKEDQRHSIDFYSEKLEKVIFQKKIGTMADKTKHIHQISSYILDRLNVTETVEKSTLRAAAISKFDLVTSMVNEFTELQGIIGEKYALISGEEAGTAQAIREHYLPVQANGSLPESIQGAVVSIADKLDTIAGCFSVGIIPSGSQDPHGLRRQAAGVLRILLANKWDIELEDLIEKSCTVYGVTDKVILDKIEQFFNDRATYLLADEALETDVVHAVLSKEIGIFHYTRDKAILLSDKKNSEQFKPLQEALVRVMNIAKKASDDCKIDTTLFETESEADLYDVYLKVRQSLKEAEKNHNAASALQEFTLLEKPINTFFEHNMVMADDEKVKHNRMSLASMLSAMIREFADLSLIEWKQHQKSYTEV